MMPLRLGSSAIVVYAEHSLVAWQVAHEVARGFSVSAGCDGAPMLLGCSVSFNDRPCLSS